MAAELFAKMLEVTGLRRGLYKKFDASQLLKMGSTAFQKELTQLTGTVSKTGPSSMPLPRDKFMVNQTVEVSWGGGNKWWPAVVRQLPVSAAQEEYVVEFEENDMRGSFHKSLIRPLQVG